MIIRKWTGPPVETHTYLLVDEPSRSAWVIDAPLNTAGNVLAHVKVEGLTLERVILTHGHFDHILDVSRYVTAGIPVAISPRERPLLEAPQTQMFGVPYPMPVFQPNEALGESDVLELGGEPWTVWDAPGHSPGHVLLYNAVRNLVAGGDLLFQGGYGRVDLPGADPAAMAESLLRLLELPDETRVLPGHGPETTIGAERVWLERLLTEPGGLRL
jgi:glyoxylase-like metal-dependent hydrolase (beta-lactamase superfamily II)